jgi:zinc protease
VTFQQLARRHNFTLERKSSWRDLAAACFRLPNGLAVVLAPNDQAVFAYQTWFSVGSRDEHPDATGIAHLLEHLMFKGTKAAPSGTFDRQLEARGADTNAATWVDWTCYTASLANQGDHLRTLVALEADRMQGTLFDAESFASELEVVRNERKQRVDDSISGTLSEALYKEAFARHPYGRPTIGWLQHLHALTLDQVRAFYADHYAPQRATVVIAGGFDPDEALASIAQAYGALGGGRARGDVAPSPPARASCTKLALESQAPQLLVAYPIPAEAHPDHAALELVEDALTRGDSARLFHRLVIQDEVATSVDGSLTPFAGPGLLELAVSLRPGADVASCLRAIDEEVARVHGGGLSAFEFEKAQSGLELSLFDELEEPEGLAEILGHWQTNTGDFSRGFAAASRFSGVTAKDIERVARAWLVPAHRLAVSA